MAAELDGCNFAIYPRPEPMQPIGVDYSRVGLQFIFLNAPVYDWKYTKNGDYYRFSVDGYAHVGVLDGKVVASINPEQGEDWIIRRVQGAYVITLAKEPEFGWTVSREWTEGRREIAIQRIKPESEPDHWQQFLFSRLSE